MKLEEDDIATFNDSLDRCVSNPRFMDIFYDKFTADPEVAEKFAETSMARQKRMLKASLYSTMMAVDGNEPAIEHLRQLGVRHVELRIGPPFYDRWRECLIDTVRECGGLFDDHVEDVWRRVLGVAILFMVPEARSAS